MQFNLTAPSIDGTPVQLSQLDWDLDIIGSSARVRIEHRAGVLSSKGDITAQTEIVENVVKVYAKGSAKPFGAGKLFTQMVIYRPDTHYGDKKIMKTLRSEVTGVQLV